MTLRELSRYYELQKRLERCKEMLISMEAAVHPEAQVLTGMPHATGGISDKTCGLGTAIAFLKDRIRELEEESQQAESEISTYINAVQDERMRTIFYLRFLRCLTWGEVAATIGGKNTEKGIQNACYRYLKSCGAVGSDEGC